MFISSVVVIPKGIDDTSSSVMMLNFLGKEFEG